MNKMFKVCILTNENEDDHKHWIEILNANKDQFNISSINLSSNDWLNEIFKLDADIFIARPPGISDQSKLLYDERLYIIANTLKRRVYPTFEEVLVYENKKFLSYFLKANGVKIPETTVFCSKKDALEFCHRTRYPIVAKFNIGASGSGIKILKTEDMAIEYINRSFSGKGAPKRWGPNLEKGSLLKRGVHYIFKPRDILKKLEIYQKKRATKQVGFLIFQEYIEHNFEWRCVRIGDSFFAHKKLKIGEMASGTLLKSYDNPPLELLDFVKDVTDKLNFSSLAIDIFETSNGEYLVNEMQCYFGQSDAFQMKVDDRIGRYRHMNGNWVFEEGDFARNACYDLRLHHLLEILQKR
jgi:glutathione synthase/RimK-type ligase-like ATP-grasp enzyme